MEFWLIPSISPSAYALFISVTINDGCGSTLTTYATSTASFAPSQLSTFDTYGVPRSFNLADLPCPPSTVRLQPGQPFRPFLAWSDQSIFQNNSFPQCDAMDGYQSVLDPPTAFPVFEGGLGGTGSAGCHRPCRLRREREDAHVTSWVPARTTTSP